MRFCGFGVFVMVKYRKSEGKNIRRVVKVFFGDGWEIWKI